MIFIVIGVLMVSIQITELVKAYQWSYITSLLSFLQTSWTGTRKEHAALIKTLALKET